MYRLFTVYVSEVSAWLGFNRKVSENHVTERIMSSVKMINQDTFAVYRDLHSIRDSKYKLLNTKIEEPTEELSGGSEPDRIVFEFKMRLRCEEDLTGKFNVFRMGADEICRLTSINGIQKATYLNEMYSFVCKMHGKTCETRTLAQLPGIICREINCKKVLYVGNSTVVVLCGRIDAVQQDEGGFKRIVEVKSRVHYGTGGICDHIQLQLYLHMTNYGYGCLVNVKPCGKTMFEHVRRDANFINEKLFQVGLKVLHMLELSASTLGSENMVPR